MFLFNFLETDLMKVINTYWSHPFNCCEIIELFWQTEKKKNGQRKPHVVHGGIERACEDCFIIFSLHVQTGDKWKEKQNDMFK